MPHPKPLTTRLLLGCSLALACAGVWAQPRVQAQVHLVLPIQAHAPAPVYHYAPPPPPRHGMHPRARKGHAWVEGHWRWQGRRQVWVPGYWVQAPRHSPPPGHWRR